MPRRLEPVTAVGYPPSKVKYGDGGCDGPPQREQEIGQESEDREDHPEYFFLHWERLGEHFRRGGAILRQSAKQEVVIRPLHSLRIVTSGNEVAVGTTIADRPPRGSARALISACGSYRR